MKKKSTNNNKIFHETLPRKKIIVNNKLNFNKKSNKKHNDLKFGSVFLCAKNHVQIETKEMLSKLFNNLIFYNCFLLN